MNSKLVVAITIRSKVLCVRNNPVAKELAFRESTEHKGTPEAADIELLQWFLTELEEDLSKLDDEPLADEQHPQPIAGPPAGEHHLHADAEAHPAVEGSGSPEAADHAASDEEVDVAAPVPKRLRCTSSIPADQEAIASGLQKLQNRENCKKSQWVPSRSCFRVGRKDNEREKQFRVRKFQKHILDIDSSSSQQAVSQQLELTLAEA